MKIFQGFKIVKGKNNITENLPLKNSFAGVH